MATWQKPHYARAEEELTFRLVATRWVALDEDDLLADDGEVIDIAPVEICAWSLVLPEGRDACRHVARGTLLVTASDYARFAIAAHGVELDAVRIREAMDDMSELVLQEMRAARNDAADWMATALPVEVEE